MQSKDSAPRPEIQPVTSGMLSGIGHDAATNTLVVVFKNDPPGVQRHYADVDRAVFDAFLTADSPGKYFGTHVRPHYTHSRIDPEPEDSHG